MVLSFTASVCAEAARRCPVHSRRAQREALRRSTILVERHLASLADKTSARDL